MQARRSNFVNFPACIWPLPWDNKHGERFLRRAGAGRSRGEVKSA